MQGGWEMLSPTQTCKALDGQQSNAQGRQTLLTPGQTGLIPCSAAQELCRNNQSCQLSRVGVWGFSLVTPCSAASETSLLPGLAGAPGQGAEALGQPCLHQQQRCGVLGTPQREGQKSSEKQRDGEAGK